MQENLSLRATGVSVIDAPSPGMLKLILSQLSILTVSVRLFATNLRLSMTELHTTCDYCVGGTESRLRVVVVR